jgi:hypothetical protein
MVLANESPCTLSLCVDISRHMDFGFVIGFVISDLLKYVKHHFSEALYI